MTLPSKLARCRQIMAAGEDWRGLAGNVARAEAVVAAARGNYDVAYRQFESALAIHQKYHLAWDEADTLQYWGRALAAAGDHVRAAEKFDAAIENHRSRGVGPRLHRMVDRPTRSARWVALRPASRNLDSIESDRGVSEGRRVLDHQLRWHHSPAEGCQGPSLHRLPARTSGAAHPRP